MPALALQPAAAPGPAGPPVAPPVPRSREQTIASLREKIGQIAPPRPRPVGLPTGLPALESATGGWPQPGVSVLHGCPGSGRLVAALPALRRLSLRGRRVAVVDASGWLHPPGLDGVLLDNLLLVRPGGDQAAWAAEQLCRSGAFPLVLLLDPPDLGRAGARLQAAVEAGQTALLVASELAQPRLPCRLRLEVGPGPGGAPGLWVRRGDRGGGGRFLPFEALTAAARGVLPFPGVGAPGAAR